MGSESAENYLKTIYFLSQGEAAATTSAIAEQLGLAAGSVTGMLKRLSEMALVEHVPYYGARLTDEGRRQALRMVRRHRLIERFLVEVLGYEWDRVHEEAERLEHAVSEELVDRMAAVMGMPDADPHGAPIPVRGEPFEEPVYPTLAEVEVGGRAVLRCVPDKDPEILRYLAGLQMVPGSDLAVLERAPFEGPVKVRVAGREHFIGAELSRQLQVEPYPVAAGRG